MQASLKQGSPPCMKNIIPYMRIEIFAQGGESLVQGYMQLQGIILYGPGPRIIIVEWRPTMYYSTYMCFGVQASSSLNEDLT